MNSSFYKGIGYELDEQAAADYVRDGYLLAPRTIFKGRVKCPYNISKPEDTNLENIPSRIKQTVQDIIGDAKGKQRAVMFSGGFDSTFAALFAQQRGAKVTAITVRFDNFNVATVQDAVASAKKLGLAVHVLSVTTVEFIAAFEAIAGITDEPILNVELAVLYAALKKYNKKVAGNVIISGMGCDHWYGNIALEERPGGFQGRVDWAAIVSEAHQRVAQLFGCGFVFPFLAKPMLELSLVIPDELKKNKKLLRTLAIVNAFPARGAKTELQIPELIRRILVKVYGNRAWPEPVSECECGTKVQDSMLRKIVLGLWLEKAKNRPDIYKRHVVSRNDSYSKIN